PISVGWRIANNSFENIVGYRGNSEGYGCNLTPGSDSVVSGNVFRTGARHAIYLTAGAQNNTVSGNVIDTCDNIAIHVNATSAQTACKGNVIADNTIRNITKS